MLDVKYEHPNTKRSIMTMEKRILLRDNIVSIDLLPPRVDDNDVSLTKIPHNRLLSQEEAYVRPWHAEA